MTRRILVVLLGIFLFSVITMPALAADTTSIRVRPDIIVLYDNGAPNEIDIGGGQVWSWQVPQNLDS